MIFAERDQRFIAAGNLDLQGFQNLEGLFCFKMTAFV